MFKQTRNAPIAFAIALLVAACGGGGGGASSTPTTPAPLPAPVPTVPAETPSDLQTSVPALTYPAASQEHIFVSELNSFRARAGLGLLAQSTFLDKASSNHLAYILTNDVLLGGTVNMRVNDPATGRSNFHIESATKPLFTGVQELDRAKAAGYGAQYIGEEIAFAGGNGGLAALTSLIGTVYHRNGLLFQAPTDVGVSVGTDLSQTVVMVFGYASKRQVNGSAYLGTYPGDNQAGVGTHAQVEVPNPFPELSLTNDDFPTKTGYPISVSIAEGSQLTVQEFTVSEASGGAPLDARILQASNDSNKLLPINTAFLVAKARLKVNTEYQVRFVGLNGAKSLSKTWKFTTGAK